MGGGNFDRLTRLLAGRLTRRSALAASALSVPAVAAARQLRGGNSNGNGNSDGKRRGKGRGHGPRQEGPCGDGSRKENVCTWDSQCCTGYCETRTGKKNVDRKGRCRCIRRGKPCSPNQSCCGTTSCVAGVCAAAAPPPPACQEAGGACSAAADCCSCLTCVSGACAPCVPIVCATGCAHTTVGAAYAAASAGDTIYIGPGTYPTAITIDKDITLAACPCATGVTLTVDRTNTPSDSYYSILVDGETDTTIYSVTVRNLTLQGTYPTNSDEALLRSSRNESINWTIDDSVLKNGYSGLWAPNGVIRITGGTIETCNYGANLGYESRTAPMTVVMTNVTVSGCDSYGVVFNPWDESSATTSTFTGCTFRDNPGYGISLQGDMVPQPQVLNTISGCTITGNDSYGLYLYGGRATVTGCTITGNSNGGVFAYDTDTTITDTSISGNSTDKGAGISAKAHFRTGPTLTLAGATLVSGNTATDVGGGIYSSQQNGSVAFTINGAGGRVSGNTPDQCYNGYSSAVVDCATWT